MSQGESNITDSPPALSQLRKDTHEAGEVRPANEPARDLASQLAPAGGDWTGSLDAARIQNTTLEPVGELLAEKASPSASIGDQLVDTTLQANGRSLEVIAYETVHGQAVHIRNLTQLKQARADAAIAESTLAQSGDAYLVMDVESGEIISANQIAARWTDTTVSPLEGASFVETVSQPLTDGYTRDDYEEFLTAVRGSSPYHETVVPFFDSADTTELTLRATVETIEDTEYLITVVPAVERQVADGPESRFQTAPVASYLNNTTVPSVITDETGEVVKRLSDSFCELTGWEQSTLEDQPLTDVLTTDSRTPKTAAELYAEAIEGGGGQISASATDDEIQLQPAGEGPPIAIDLFATRIRMAGRSAFVVKCIPRADARARAGAATELATLAGDIADATGRRDVADSSADRLSEVGPVAVATTYLPTPDTAQLVGYHSLEDRDRCAHPDDISPESRLWKTYADGVPQVFTGDETACDDAVCQVAVPLEADAQGVVVLSTTNPHVSEETLVSIGTLYAQVMTPALLLIERNAAVTEMESALKDTERDLERVSKTNERVRSLMQALFTADSREEIKTRVCEELIAVDDADGIMVASADTGDGTIEIDAHRGVSDSVETALTEETWSHSPTPTLQAAAQEELVIESDLPKATADWATYFQESRYLSVVSVPVSHRGIRYGVVTIFSKTSLSAQTQEMIEDISQVIGYVLNSASSRSALLSNQGTDLQFTLHQGCCGLSRLAQELEATVEVKNVTGTYVATVHIDDADPDRIEATGAEIGAIGQMRAINASAGIYQVSLGEPGPLAISEIGVELKTARTAPGATEITVTLPPEREKEEFIEQVKTQFVDGPVSISTRPSTNDTMPWADLVDTALTSKQAEALRTAYFADYFASPSNTTGAELGEDLGVAQPTISSRLRAAQRNLFAKLWDHDGGSA